MALQPSVSITLENITPNKAQRWLELHNQGNRRLSKRHVNLLASDMGKGQWRLTHEPVAFEEGGRLIDGQHRLAAVSQSGRSQKMYVARGLAAGSQLYIDNGRRRSLTDAAMFVDDLGITPKTESIIRAAVDPMSHGDKTRIDLLGLYRRHQGAVEFVVNAFKGCPGAVRTAGVMGVMVRAYYGGEYAQSRLLDLAHAMREGVCKTAGDKAAARLRDHCLFNKRDAKWDRRETVRYAAYCVHKFLSRDGRVRKQPSDRDKLTFFLPEERGSTAVA